LILLPNIGYFSFIPSISESNLIKEDTLRDPFPNLGFEYAVKMMHPGAKTGCRVPVAQESGVPERHWLLLVLPQFHGQVVHAKSSKTNDD
jgi:hypothetical protein